MIKLQAFTVKCAIMCTFLFTLAFNNVIGQYKTTRPGVYTSSSTWLGGVVPPVNSDVVISHAVTINSASVSVKKLTVAGNGSLTIDNSGALMASGTLAINGGTLVNDGGTINVGTSGGGDEILNLSSGTLDLESGVINVNGRIVMRDGNFVMRNGNLNIDPNTGSASTSVATDVDIFNVFSEVKTDVKGGTITFVDPPYDGEGSSFAYKGEAGNANWEGNTIVFGGTNGTNTDFGAINGFNIDTRATGESYILLGNVIVNGGGGTNRYVTGPKKADHGFDVGGDLTINSNSTIKTFANGAVLRIKGDIRNNGTYYEMAGISFSQRNQPNTVAQSVTGGGRFYNTGNMRLNAPFFTNLEFNNTATPVAVTFSFGNGNPNIYVTDHVAFINGVIAVPGPNHMYFMEKATASRQNGFLLTQKGRLGTMAKLFPKGASKFTFHIGDNTGNYDYTPATIEFNSSSIARYMGVKVDDGVYANLAKGNSPNHYLTRSWEMYGETARGTWDATFTFKYLSEDVVGSTSKMKFSRWNGTGWEQFKGQVTSNGLSYRFNQSTLPRKRKAVFTAKNGRNNSSAKSITEETETTSIAKTSESLTKLAEKVTVFPNPVRGGLLNVQLTSMPAGKYNIVAYSNGGQLIYSKSVTYSGGSLTEQVNLPSNLTTGIYTLIINNAEKVVSRQNILVQN